MSERHAHFFGSDPEMSSYDTNIKAIRRNVGNSFRVICGHCTVTLCATVSDPPDPSRVDIVWRNEGGFFGSFTVLQ